MNVLSVWIKNIVIVIILASLLEMLLSQGNIQRFVRVVMGLLLTLMILNPILGLVQQQTFLEHRLQSISLDLVPRNGVAGIIARGKELGQSNQIWIAQAFQGRVERQSEDYALTVAGVGQARAKVLLAAAPGGVSKLSRLQIAVSTSPAETGERVKGEVKPVVISVNDDKVVKPPNGSTGTARAENERIRRELIKTFNNYYGLLPEQIDIEITD